MESLIFKISWRLILYPALFYLVFSLFVFYLYVHPGRYVSVSKPSDRGIVSETVKLFTSDGVELAGWYIPNKKSDKAVIVCHGYPMDKGDIYPMASFLGKHFNLLLFDFRAMGRSEGFFSTGGAREVLDVDAAIEFLGGKGFGSVGLFGFSLGASTILMSGNPAVKARVADSPFSSIGAELDHVFRGYGVFRHPLIWLMKGWSMLILGVNTDRNSPLKRITGVKTPILVIHGENDTQVPVEASHRLKAANPDIELWIIRNAGHGETGGAAGRAYEQKIAEFFKNNL